MAFPIPSFLQFAPPEAAIADLGKLRDSAMNREQNLEINLAELGLKRQQLAASERSNAMEQASRNADLEFRQLALQNNMTMDMAKMAQDRAKMDMEAQIAMVQFQGNQDLQRDLAAGVPFEQAIQRNISKITHGNPAALTGYANSLQRTKTQAEIAAEREANKFDIRNIMEAGLDSRLGTVEEGRNTRADLDRLAKIDAEAQKQKNRIELIEKRFSLLAPKLSPPENASMNAEFKELGYKGLNDEEFQSELGRIEAKYKSRIGAKPTSGKTSRKPGLYEDKAGNKMRVNNDGTETRL